MHGIIINLALDNIWGIPVEEDYDSTFSFPIFITSVVIVIDAVCNLDNYSKLEFIHSGSVNGQL